MPIVVKIATTDDINSTESINLLLHFLPLEKDLFFGKDKAKK